MWERKRLREIANDYEEILSNKLFDLAQLGRKWCWNPLVDMELTIVQKKDLCDKLRFFGYTVTSDPDYNIQCIEWD